MKRLTTAWARISQPSPIDVCVLDDGEGTDDDVAAEPRLGETIAVGCTLRRVILLSALDRARSLAP